MRVTGNLFYITWSRTLGRQSSRKALSERSSHERSSFAYVPARKALGERSVNAFLAVPKAISANVRQTFVVCLPRFRNAFGEHSASAFLCTWKYVFMHTGKHEKKFKKGFGSGAMYDGLDGGGFRQ